MPPLRVFTLLALVLLAAAVTVALAQYAGALALVAPVALIAAAANRLRR